MMSMPSMPPTSFSPPPAGTSLSSSARRWVRSVQDLQRDRLLLGAVVTCALLLGFQLVVLLRQPPWIGSVTDWLRAALAWPQLLIVVAVSRWLRRRRRPEALS